MVAANKKNNKSSKPAPKAAKPAAKSPTKKVSAKPVPKKKPEPAKKPQAKAAAPSKAAPAKPAAKTGGTAKPEKKPAAAAAKKIVPVKAAAKPVKAAPVPVKAAAPVKASAVPAKAPAVEKGKAGSKPAEKAVPEKLSKADKAAAAKAAALAAKAEAKPVIKKPTKSFFHEVANGAERIIKRGDKTSTIPVPLDIQNRRKGGGEESPEELVERIERELEHQHIFKRNMLRPQLCTKCGLNEVSDRFTIDKELGYCDDCAEILHLGETKEARKIDFHPSLMKKDGDGAAEGAEPGAEDDDDEDEEDEKGPPAVVPDIDV
jgi:hypothetical protein